MEQPVLAVHAMRDFDLSKKRGCQIPKMSENRTFLTISRQPLVGITRCFLRLQRYTLD